MNKSALVRGQRGEGCHVFPYVPSPQPSPGGRGGQGGRVHPTARRAGVGSDDRRRLHPQNSELGRLDKIFGRHGISDGRFQKPRAMTIDAPRPPLHLRYDRGSRSSTRTETSSASGKRRPRGGRPTGLSIGIDGNLLVADTHYYRVLIYSPQGKLLRIMGGRRGTGRASSGW